MTVEIAKRLANSSDDGKRRYGVLWLSLYDEACQWSPCQESACAMATSFYEALMKAVGQFERVPS